MIDIKVGDFVKCISTITGMLPYKRYIVSRIYVYTDDTDVSEYLDVVDSDGKLYSGILYSRFVLDIEGNRNSVINEILL